MLDNLLWAYINTNWLENREPTPEEIEEIEAEERAEKGREIEFNNSHEVDNG